jgi:N utilization substance protein B
MQALYSYYLMKDSLKEMVCDELVGKHALDPAIHDFMDKDIIESKQEAIRTSFYEFFETGKSKTSEDFDSELTDEIKASIENYQDLIGKELSAIRKNMMAETKAIFRLYLKILLIPGELAFADKQLKERSEKAHIKKDIDWKFNLSANPLIQDLESLNALVKLTINEKISWKEDVEIIRQWYKDLIKTDDEVMSYAALESPDPEDHQKVIEYILKKIIFKRDATNAYFYEKDLRWTENKSIIRSMVLKTIKSYDPELDEKFELKSLSYNEKEDFEYFEKLFKETVKKNQYLEGIIAKKAKNWDLTRIATIDMIILKMALTEMMIFPSIPIKVTINEFIEISKNYSTPKSKQFINGILDVLANELTSEGTIKKSGRGLIDNK